MVSKNFRFRIISRIGFLALFIFLSCWFLRDFSTFTLGLVSVLLAIVQSIFLLLFIEKSQKEIINFLGFIQYDDFSVTYPAKIYSGTTKQLYEEYNKVIRKFRALRTDKETNLHFFKSILQHIDIGIFAFNKSGEIKIINTSALRLLNLNRIENLKIIESLYPAIYAALVSIEPRQKSILKLDKRPEPISISISSVELTINGEVIKLISIQNIQSELDEKEMEAWQNMIRVMTHEIMNSLTPITSLAATVSDEINEWRKTETSIQIQETNDMFHALKTIKKRSEGLLHFVEDFRNLSQIPKPKIELFALKPFLDSIHLLMKQDLTKCSITLEIKLEPEQIKLSADIMLIEQVLINIIKNALESFENASQHKQIIIRAFYNSESKIEIWIQDNGKGIEPEILEKVFIPFYSTKKTGSGIGLTISKQIMRMHKGTINISSELNKGSLVKLIF